MMCRGVLVRRLLVGGGACGQTLTPTQCLPQLSKQTAQGRWGP